MPNDSARKKPDRPVQAHVTKREPGPIETLEGDYTGSYIKVEDCPKPIWPEYAFIGRSNVGKSSLINSLAGRRKLALVSRSPGKTQTINYFYMERSWYLVDLPGYGYAKVSKTQRAKWERMLRGYLVRRDNLQCVFLLIDGSIAPQRIDLEFADWLGELMIPFVLVFTKTDKVPSSKRKGMVKAFEAAMLERWEELPQRFVTSAVRGTGREEMLDFIRRINAGFKKPQAG